MTDCQDCKDYRECISPPKWFHYGQIRWCPYQCIWIISNADTLRDGRWPKNPEGADDNEASSKMVKTEATFTKPILILAELEQRLQRTGVSGRSLVAQIEDGREFESLDRDARDALLYVKGWRHKKDGFSKWKKERKYRNKHTSRYAHQKNNGHKHLWILDENNLGKCKCGATKQFPNEKKLKLLPHEISFIEGLEMPYDPDNTATLHGVRT